MSNERIVLKGGNLMFKNLKNLKFSKNPKQMLIFTVMMIIILVAYFYLRDNKDSESMKLPNTEASRLLVKDVEIDYPATPTSVVKLYSRIIKTLYNDKWKNEEVDGLIQMLRLLYSEELLSKNEQEKYNTTIKSDIAEYNDKQKEIINYRVDGKSQVVTWKKDGVDYASLNVMYSMREKKDSFKIYENFILIKEKDKWKIVGWTSVPEVDIVE